MKKHPLKKFSNSMTVENISQRVQWLIWLRWIAGTSVVICVLAGKAFFALQSVTIPLLLGVGILFYNGIFELIRSRYFKYQGELKLALQRRFMFINIQIFLDLMVLAALIYFTGGIANPLLYFFIFHMVISSILLSRVNAYCWAFFTIILESILFYLEHAHIIPSWKFLPSYPAGLVDNSMQVLFMLLAFGVTLLITVYFATSIMRPIRKRQLDLMGLKNSLKKQRDQLEIKNRELHELDHSKTEFLYRVEHELKAPIGAIQSLLSVVLRGYASVSEEKKKELLTRAENRVYMMKELVTDLLSLSRVSERSFKLNIEPVDIEEIIRQVIQDLMSYSHKKGIQINMDTAAHLPPINADKTALIEIIRNLVHNAVKYSFEGEVRVSAVSEDNRLILTVQDPGIGINEEDLELIFTEFYRTPNAKAFTEGSGLGLSLVKRLIEKHQGTIEVASQINKGTTFTVTFPINQTNST